MSDTNQFKAWALDRAIETLKAGGEKIDPEEVKSVALNYMHFVVPEPTEPEPEYNAFSTDEEKTA